MIEIIIKHHPLVLEDNALLWEGVSFSVESCVFLTRILLDDALNNCQPCLLPKFIVSDING